MRRLTVATAVLVLLVGAGLANGSVTTFTAPFGDDSIHWGNDVTGWKSVSSPYTGTYSNAGINAMEHIGVPDLFGGTATGEATIVSSNGVAWLKSITIGYNSNLEPGYNNILRYGDLFLATGTDGTHITNPTTTWNYVVQGDHSVGYVSQQGPAGYNNSTNLAVKSFSSGISQAKGVNDSDYWLSNTSTQRNSTAGWSGFAIRYDHPWALSDTFWNSTAGTTDGQASFSGWQDNNPTGSSTWTFANQQIRLAESGGVVQGFRLAFSPQCANDVLLEDVGPLGAAPTAPIPEPASLIAWSLLGCCVAAAAGWRRFRKAA